jgi:hypothetical protein
MIPVISMCKTSTKDKKCSSNRRNTVIFLKNKTGLKKGDPLSPILFNLALQKVIQSIKMVPSGIKVGKERLNILIYADDIALIGKNEIKIRNL